MAESMADRQSLIANPSSEYSYRTPRTFGLLVTVQNTNNFKIKNL